MNKRQIRLSVHPAAEVSAVLMPSGKSYYLSLKSPMSSARDTSTLLARLVESRPDLAFMAKFTLRTATSIVQLVTAGDGTLVLRQMADADLVREHPVVEFSTLDDRLLELAGLPADQQTTPFVEAVHGSGKTTIIASYAAANLDPAATTAEAIVAQATVTDMAAALEAMPAAGTKTKPAKKPAVRRTAKVAS